MNIALFGASGPTGRLVLQQALDEGHRVVAFTRKASSISVQHEQLQIVEGDVFDRSAVEKAVKGQDVVISLLGAPFSFKPVKVFSDGTRNITQAMYKYGVRRLLCVISGRATPMSDPQLGIVFNWFFKRTRGYSVFADMRRLEQIVMKSGLDWTIIRPALLDNRPRSGYQIADDCYIIPDKLQTARADLADFLLKCMRESQYRNKAVAIATDPNAKKNKGRVRNQEQ